MDDGLRALNINQALTGRDYRADIDGLRALAVVPVVLYHAGVPGFSGGFVGVDVFFVISGYLITRILTREFAEGRFSYLDFYERRARRIMPALLFVLAATSAAAWLILLPDQFADYGLHLLATLGFVANLVYMTEIGDYFSPDAEFIPLLHMWSLGVEEQFYILFPVLLAIGARAGRRWSEGLVVVACVGSLVAAIALERTAPSHAFYFTGTRVWELGLGALLAMGWFSTPLTQRAREALGVAGLLLIVGPVAFYDSATPFPGLAALAPCAGAALLIATGRRTPTIASKALSMRPVVLIGLISYSLYLWHWPILALLRARAGVVELPPEQIAAAIAASIALATLSWSLVERPFRLRDRISRRTAFALSGGGAGVLAVFGVGVFAADGLPDRLPLDVARLASATQDHNPRREECVNRSPRAGLCAVGDARDGATDFLVWGDSHADALMPAFETAAMESSRSGRIAIRTGCPPLLGVRRDVRLWRSCVAHNNAMIAYLRDSKDMQTVFLVARWAQHATGTGPGDTPTATVSLIELEPGAGGASSDEAPFARSLARTVRAIRETGRAVVLIGATPEFGWNVPVRLAATTWHGLTAPTGPDRDSVGRRNADVDAVFRTLAADDPGVRILSLADAFCDPRCRPALDDRPLYRDDNHVSSHGARAIAGPPIAEFLKTPSAG